MFGGGSSWLVSWLVAWLGDWLLMVVAVVWWLRCGSGVVAVVAWQ